MACLFLSVLAVEQLQASEVDGDEDPLPPGVIARLGTKRYRPTHSALAVVFLPGTHTSSMLTTGGAFERWDAETGRIERSIRILNSGDEQFTRAVATSDGRFFATRGMTFRKDGQRPLWWLAIVEADTGRERLRINIEEFHGEGVALSADGRTIAADGFVDGESKLCVFDVATRSEIARRGIGKKKVRSMAFSPDAETIGVGSDDGIVRLWKWQLEEEPREVDVCHNPRQSVLVLSLAFSPEDSTLAVGAYQSEQLGVFVVPLAAPEQKRGLSVEDVNFWHPKSVAFSRDGRLLAAPINGSNARGGVAVWEAATGKVAHRFEVPMSNYTSLAFSRDGTRLAAASDWDTRMAVWDLATGKRMGEELPGHTLPPGILKFTPDDDLLISSGDDGTLRVWDVASGKQTRVTTIDNGNFDVCWIRAMDVSADGAMVAASILDNSIRVWSIASGSELWRSPGHGKTGGCRALRFLPDGKVLASWGDDLRLRRWDTGSGKLLTERPTEPDGVKLPKPGAVFGGAPSLGYGLFSRDGSRLIMQFGNSTHELDTSSGAEIARFPSGAPGAPLSVALSPEGQMLLEQRWFGPQAVDHPVALTNIADGKVVGRASLPGRHGGPVAFSNDGRLAAVGSYEEDPYVQILSVPDLKELAKLSGLTSRPHAVEFSRSGKSLAVSTAGGSILLWQLESR
ncbi:MAG TPA: WD40 repeat domain-containing protein [Pirellulales bacterium]|jgi:WD40 repeat protein